MTRVSVIIPVWNRAGTIAPAIDSVLAQRFPSGEWTVRIIVVDDGSSDGLIGALQPYGSRVACVRHDRNMGAAAARNSGVRAADGELVAFLDSDDVWLPDKLASQIAFMRQHGFVASCTAVRLIRSGVRDIVWPRYPSGGLSQSNLIWGCFVSPGSTLVCRRSAFDEIGTFEPSMPRLEDWDWLLRYAQRYPLGFLAQPLAQVEPSSNRDLAASMKGIAVMQSRHMPAMTGSLRRSFAAALDFERAGAHYRSGEVFSAGLMVFKSLIRAPLRHGAMAAALHNRLLRR
jgi:glycosyltransferase involved in cell wall biosynthesis